MFDFLHSVSIDDVTEVVYSTNLLLQWRSPVRTDWLLKQLSAREKKLVMKAVNEIEEAEKSSLYNLPEDIWEKYIGKLSSILMGRISATMTDADRKWVRETLARWEKEDKEFPLQLVRKKQRSPRAVKTNGKRRAVAKHPN